MIDIGNLRLDTDFEYRIIREEDNDIDLFIDVNYRSLDVLTNDGSFFNSRIQFPFVRALVLRINKDTYTMTVHMMRDIDLFSAFANFEIDYQGSILRIKNNQEKVNFFKDKVNDI